MTTDTQTTEREAVEMIARWMRLPEYGGGLARPDAPACFNFTMQPGKVLRGRRFDYGDRWWDFMFEDWNPFTNPADAWELLAAVQERWARPALEERTDRRAVYEWWSFIPALKRRVLSRVPSMDLPDDFAGLAAYLQPADIAHAVAAVLRQYPETET